MKKYSEIDRTKEAGIKSPTREIAIVKDKEGRRTVINRDQCVVVPYFRDEEQFLMKAGKPTEWVKEGSADGQHLYFPNALYWDSAFTEGSIKHTLYESGITINDMSELYYGPVMQRGIEQSGRIRFHLVVLSWWDYKMSINNKEKDQTLLVNLKDIDDLEFSDVCTAYAASWSIKTILEQGLSNWYQG